MKKKRLALVATIGFICCVVLSGCSSIGSLGAPHTELLALRGNVKQVEFSVDSTAGATTAHGYLAGFSSEITRTDRVVTLDFNKQGYITKLKLEGENISLGVQYNKKNHPRKIALRKGAILVGQLLFNYHWLSGKLKSIELNEGADNLLLSITADKKQARDTTYYSITDGDSDTLGKLILTTDKISKTNSIALLVRDKKLAQTTFTLNKQGDMEKIQIIAGVGQKTMGKVVILYNEQGQIKAVGSKIFGRMLMAEYTKYNEHGDVAQSKISDTYTNNIGEHSYTYDAHQNWTKLTTREESRSRSITPDMDESVEETEVETSLMVISRKIKYYDKK